MPVSTCSAAPPRHLLAATKASHSANSVVLLITGCDIEFGERVRSLGRKAVEHVDRGIARPGARAPRFGDIGDEKGLAAGLGKLRSDRLETEPIGIGLDHGAAFDGEQLAGKRAPVRLDGIEINGQRPAGLRVVLVGCRLSERLCEGHAAL